MLILYPKIGKKVFGRNVFEKDPVNHINIFNLTIIFIKCEENLTKHQWCTPAQDEPLPFRQLSDN